MAAKTSAIVLSHNYGRYLAQCLESILAQTLPFDEILVVDDASSDNTAEICRQYGAEGVKYLRTEWHHQEAARHSGVKAASCDFMVFVDADDWLAHDYHKKMHLALMENPAAGFAYSGVHLAKEGVSADWFPGHQHPMRPYCFFDFWRQNPVATAPILRRTAWPEDVVYQGVCKNNGKAYGEDWERLLALLHRGWTSVLIPERLVYYRIHSENTSREALSNSGLEDHAKREIQHRFAAYEVTVLFLLGRGPEEGKRALRSLSAMKLPAHSQIILVRAYEDPMEIPPGFHARQIRCPKPPEQSDAQWTQNAVERARSFVRGEKVLLVGDKVLLTPDTYFLLKKQKALTRADLYSAHTSASRPETARAWRAAGADPWLGVIQVPITRKPKRVLAAGWDLTLMDSGIFHDRDLLSLANKIPYKPLELAAGMLLHKKNKRWFAQGASAVFARSNRTPWQSFTTLSQKEPAWPKVSIIIPVKNNRGSLKELLTSLNGLDYPQEKYEVLVIDNGSTDGSPEMAGTYAGVRVLRESAQGSYAARNRGITESKYPLIAFVDSDCTVTRGWLKELVVPMQDPYAGAAAGTNRARYPDFFVSRYERKAGLFLNYPGKPGGQPPYAITMNILYRREVFETCGLFNAGEKSGSDVEMCWRMQNAGEWKLALLEDSAWVIHQDPRALTPYIQRHFRIGTGQAGLFALYPEYRSPLYFWMPRTFWEIALQAFKHFLSGLFEKRKLSLAELFLKTLRHFLLKAGFLKRTNQLRKKQETAERVLIYFGKEISPRESAACQGLLKQARGKTQVLYVSPAAAPWQSLAQLALSAAGGTTRWEWAPFFESLQLWKFPFLPDAVNKKLQTLRILKAVRRNTSRPLTISGDTASVDLLKYQALLGKKRARLVPPQNFLLDKIKFPALGCVLPKGASEFLDLAYYQKLSEESVWPVIISGIFSLEEQHRLEAAAFDFPNLFVIAFKTPEEITVAGSLLSAIVCAWTHRPSNASEEEYLDLPSNFTGPRLRLFPGSLRIDHGAGYSFRSLDETLRWLKMWQTLPGWNWQRFWLPPEGEQRRDLSLRSEMPRRPPLELDAVSALP